MLQCLDHDGQEFQLKLDISHSIQIFSLKRLQWQIVGLMQSHLFASGSVCQLNFQMDLIVYTMQYGQCILQ